MKRDVRRFLFNFAHAFSANVISLLISVLSILIVPKVIGISEYGYWQLYTFYASYMGFFHFGLADGVYLKYGGTAYDKLNHELMHGQFFLLVSFESAVTLLMLLYGLYLGGGTDRGFVVMMVALNLFLVLPKTLLSYLLQVSSRIKEYARVTSAEKILYGISLILLLCVGLKNYRLMILLDLLMKAFSLMLACLYCRDIILCSSASLRENLREATDNIRVGIKLMFANIASALIIGIVRFCMERQWSIETFGKVSLTLSISNMLMVFINAVGIVLYPMLRNTPEEQLPSIYGKMRNLLMFFLIGMLAAFYPAKTILMAWLPQYADTLPYMALLFPICLYESKMSMLINTYFKTLRMEKLMMTLNWITVGISLLTSGICVFVLQSLTLSVFSITLLMGAKCILSELMLTKTLRVEVKKDILLELAMTVIFISLAWFLGNWIGFLLYLTAYVSYVAIKRRDALESIRMIRAVLSREPLRQLSHEKTAGRERDIVSRKTETDRGRFLK